MFWAEVKNRQAASFRRLTGVNKKTFRLMVKAVKESEEKKVKKRGNHRSRPYSLSMEDQVLLTLMYYREYRLRSSTLQALTTSVNQQYAEPSGA